MFIIRGQLLPGLEPKKRYYRRIIGRRGEPATIECPPRRWIVLNLDGVEVPNGLGAPDKVAEAAYFIRDNLLPSYFRGVRCVAVATASTGRKGPNIARLRMFFVLSHPEDNDVLYYWVDSLSTAHPNLGLDPSVMRAMQPIYTARPIFQGITDPVPVWGRVRVLDGCEEFLSPDLPRNRKPKRVRQHDPVLNGVNGVAIGDASEEWLALTEQYSGRGVGTIEPPTEPTPRAWIAIKRIYEMLYRCGLPPKVGKQGRHMSLTRAGYELACLVAEGELPEVDARDAYKKAAKRIFNGDGKYDDDAIRQRLDDAFIDVCGL
jgi:hypothetical protein